jgi:hypothetical protein
MTPQLVVFDDELLSRSKTGTVWGRIYFDLGDHAFPEKGWSDMAVAFVNAWLEAVMQVAVAGAPRERVHFMDGPLAVDLCADASGLAKLTFTHKDTVRHFTTARVDELLQNAVSVGIEMLSICKSHGWLNDSDFLRLVANVEKGAKALPV